MYHHSPELLQQGSRLYAKADLAAAIAADIVNADVTVMFSERRCQPSSVGSLSFSNRYLMKVAFAFPFVTSPNADKMSEYSSSDPLVAKVALNVGLVAFPYANRAECSAAATSIYTACQRLFTSGQDTSGQDRGS